MYRSVEVRWFSTHRDESILSWFEKHGYDFDSAEPRTDYYLISNLKNDLGVKLREGSIELKQRKSNPEAITFSATVTGFSEEWVKWSFNFREDDIESEKILKNASDQWMPVKKKRIQVKLGDGDVNQVADSGNLMDAGCLMEYTWLWLQKKIFYSFAVEAFGSGPEKLRSSLLQHPFLLQILKNFTFSEKDSFGYPEFLLKNLEK